jgi:hypothetical protein
MLKVYSADDSGRTECIVNGKNQVIFSVNDSISEYLFSGKIIPMDSVRNVLPQIDPMPGYFIRQDTIQFKEAKWRKWSGYIYVIKKSKVIFHDNWSLIVDFKIVIDDTTFAIVRASLYTLNFNSNIQGLSLLDRKWVLSRIMFLYGQTDI